MLTVLENFMKKILCWFELPYVQWSYRMVIHSDAKGTLFRLTFRQNVIILIEIGHPLDHVSNYYEDMDDWLRAKNLDFLERDREKADIWLIAYKEKIKKYFDKQV